MNRSLLEILICPACLPLERPLEATVVRQEEGDILAGRLDCPGCGGRYPIEEGTAYLLPKEDVRVGEQGRYGEAAAVSAYLWSHYGDTFGVPGACRAYRRWADLLPEGASLSLDLGCAAGRMSWELAARSELAVGIDRSAVFVRLARRLAAEGRLDFDLTVEGRLTERRSIRLPPAWAGAPVEFLVADATAPPFPAGLFDLVASLNLLDRLSRPRTHLQEIGRVAAAGGARLLFSDPFSWSIDCAPETEWLGGRSAGPYPGRGMENVRRILEGESSSPWRVVGEGALWWKIRNHRNHFELIRSEYLLAAR